MEIVGFHGSKLFRSVHEHKAAMGEKMIFDDDECHIRRSRLACAWLGPLQILGVRQEGSRGEV